MPIISQFFGIKITIYWDDHQPPHFHAHYGEAKARFAIRTGELLAGWLPRRQFRLVRTWARLHERELLANWNRAVAHDILFPIEPLP